MAPSLTHSKRPIKLNPLEPDERGKLRKTAGHPCPAPLKLSGAVVFRILCPASKCGSVIGKGGSTVVRIENKTGAKVRLEKLISGCEERVIAIIGSNKHADATSNEHNEEKCESSVSQAPKLRMVTSSAQNALIMVYERIIEGELQNDSGDESAVTVRLLCHSSQVGCLLGKHGSIMKRMASDSGAQIQILAKDKIPLCASQQDDVVQISGRIDSAKKALQSVALHLSQKPPRDLSSAANPHGTSSQIPRANLLPVERPQLSFRLLCSNNKVGSVIGWHGSIVKSLERETGCLIKCLEPLPGSEDRIIVISGPVVPGDRLSPAQEGVLRVQQRMVIAVPDNRETIIVSRLLISSNQTGCLLGKGGGVIAEMKELSGADICIFRKDKMLKNVPENDQVVQITGELGAVQEALVQVTARLKSHFFGDKIPAMNHAGHPAIVPPFGPYMGKREPSPQKMLLNLPPTQRDIGGHLLVERSPIALAIQSSRVPLHEAERTTSAPLAAQDMREAVLGRLSEYAGASGSGNQPSAFIHTTINVVVPKGLLPSICGQDGYNLRQICKISEAQVTIIEPRPEARETVINISGTCDQVYAARSLIQAFVQSETATS